MTSEAKMILANGDEHEFTLTYDSFYMPTIDLVSYSGNNFQFNINGAIVNLNVDELQDKIQITNPENNRSVFIGNLTLDGFIDHFDNAQNLGFGAILGAVIVITTAVVWLVDSYCNEQINNDMARLTNVGCTAKKAEPCRVICTSGQH